MEPFVSLDDLTDALGEDVTTSDIAVIALDSACQQVRDYLANVVNLTEETITLDGNGRRRLVLPQPPVREITDVKIDGVTLDTTDYILDRERFLLRPLDATTITSVLIEPISPPWGWPIGLSNIEVTYTHGWDASEPDSAPPADFERVPSSIRLAALSLAKRIFASYGSSAVAGAVTSEWLGRYRYIVESGSATEASSAQLTADERVLLDPYKVYVYA